MESTTLVEELNSYKSLHINKVNFRSEDAYYVLCKCIAYFRIEEVPTMQ